MMKLVRNVNWNWFVQFRPFYKRGHCKILVFYSFSGLVAIGSLVFFLVGMSCAFLYLFDSYPVLNSSSSSVDKCDVFEGSWIRDESYPLYNASQFPFAEIGFNCFANGRKDGGYAKWRWKPKNCDIPRFGVRTVLEKLRGNCNDGSHACSRLPLLSFLYGNDDYSCNDGSHVCSRLHFFQYLSVRFSSFDLRIDFYRSVFLVQPATVPIRSRKRVNQEWIDSDILIFNSGHWWTPSKLFDMGCYFQVGKSLRLGMPITAGFRTALNTWASLVETMVNTNMTSVFFRTFESSHWSSWGKDRSTISDIIIKIVRKMKVLLIILHVTPMVSFRSNGHVGICSNNPSVPDCSHWCLPGVPDMWNEILLNLLPMNQSTQFQEREKPCKAGFTKQQLPSATWQWKDNRSCFICIFA
ncbi:protein trichome berefringence-like 7 [Pyrus ussuriensis x Pyrus communis]|uniref:Protein trichome berefringence-like 7 n=1 Tax=Pyrus ussuriensis x Pyrus communis TaxID=2448454 RepID=A0A5N5FKF1_9ROSA|nr:protein trichome berefringence-like 7 [Pyrus ussuriensis x Pyrus communis]